MDVGGGAGRGEAVLTGMSGHLRNSLTHCSLVYTLALTRHGAFTTTLHDGVPVATACCPAVVPFSCVTRGAPGPALGV